MTAHGILERRQRVDLDDPHRRIDTLHAEAQRNTKHRMIIRNYDRSFLQHDPQAPNASPADFIGLRLPAQRESGGMLSRAEVISHADRKRVVWERGCQYV